MEPLERMGISAAGRRRSVEDSLRWRRDICAGSAGSAGITLVLSVGS